VRTPFFSFNPILQWQRNCRTKKLSQERHPTALTVAFHLLPTESRHPRRERIIPWSALWKRFGKRFVVILSLLAPVSNFTALSLVISGQAAEAFDGESPAGGESELPTEDPEADAATVAASLRNPDQLGGESPQRLHSDPQHAARQACSGGLRHGGRGHDGSCRCAGSALQLALRC